MRCSPFRLCSAATVVIAGGARTAASLLVLATMAGCSIDYFRGLEPDDARLAGTNFRYEYEVFGLTSMPQRPLRMIVELHYDMMPALHVERVQFVADGSVLMSSDYFAWLMHPWNRRELLAMGVPEERLPKSALEFAAPEWASVEERDGAALRALFDGYEAPGYSSLADFDRLPETEATPLSLRWVGAERRW